MQVGTFCWFECGTTDMGAAKPFYTNLFGWNATDVPMPGDLGGQYTLLQVGDDDIAGMFELSGPQFAGVPSHWMIYVRVESADQTAARAEELGATLVQAPMDVPGVGRMAFLADPTGANIAIFEPGEHRGAVASASNLGWGELHTGDPEAARAFYTELFDWAAKEDPSGQYTEFQVAGRSIGGMMAIPPESADTPPHWLLYAMVDDCDASLARVQELGGQVIVPAQDIPDVGRFGVIMDPTGAALAIIRLTGPAA